MRNRNKIPKIIHQTYKTKNLPDLFRKNLEINKRNTPGYTFKLYDDNDIVNFIRKEYGKKMLKLYKSINPEYGAAKSDFWRYLVIYRYGGIYLDIKSAIHTPIDKLVKPKDRLIFSTWKSWSELRKLKLGKDISVYDNKNNKHLGEATQWCLISEPRHPIIRDVILLMINKFQSSSLNIKGSIEVLKLTGPFIYSQVLTKHLNQSTYRFINYNQFKNTIEYSAMIDRFNKHHEKVFKNHYTKQKTPILNRKFSPKFYKKILLESRL